MMETSALELERKERKKWKKKNPDQGFSGTSSYSCDVDVIKVYMLSYFFVFLYPPLDFAQAQHRQYERLTKQMEPDMATYEKKKQEMGESFYPGVNTLLHGAKPSEAAIDRMVDDLEMQ